MRDMIPDFDINDLNHYTAKATMEMAETQDAFIFKTIGPFINDVAGFEVSKRELVDAIQLIRLKKETAEKYGASLNCDLTKATDMSRELGEAYDRGIREGEKRERRRLLRMLEEDLEDLEE